MTSPNTTSALILAAQNFLNATERASTISIEGLGQRRLDLINAIDAKRKAMAAAKRRFAHQQKVATYKSLGLVRGKDSTGKTIWE